MASGEVDQIRQTLKTEYSKSDGDIDGAISMMKAIVGDGFSEIKLYRSLRDECGDAGLAVSRLFDDNDRSVTPAEPAIEEEKVPHHPIVLEQITSPPKRSATRVNPKSLSATQKRHSRKRRLSDMDDDVTSDDSKSSSLKRQSNNNQNTSAATSSKRRKRSGRLARKVAAMSKDESKNNDNNSSNNNSRSGVRGRGGTRSSRSGRNSRQRNSAAAKKDRSPSLDETCSLCFDDIDGEEVEIYLQCCQETFYHDSCLRSYLARTPSCPLCNVKCSVSDLKSKQSLRDSSEQPNDNDDNDDEYDGSGIEDDDNWNPTGNDDDDEDEEDEEEEDDLNEDDMDDDDDLLNDSMNALSSLARRNRQSGVGRRRSSAAAAAADDDEDVSMVDDSHRTVPSYTTETVVVPSVSADVEEKSDHSSSLSSTAATSSSAAAPTSMSMSVSNHGHNSSLVTSAMSAMSVSVDSTRCRMLKQEEQLKLIDTNSLQKTPFQDKSLGSCRFHLLCKKDVPLHCVGMINEALAASKVRVIMDGEVVVNGSRKHADFAMIIKELYSNSTGVAPKFTVTTFSNKLGTLAEYKKTYRRGGRQRGGNDLFRLNNDDSKDSELDSSMSPPGLAASSASRSTSAARDNSNNSSNYSELYGGPDRKPPLMSEIADRLFGGRGGIEMDFDLMSEWCQRLSLNAVNEDIELVYEVELNLVINSQLSNHSGPFGSGREKSLPSLTGLNLLMQCLFPNNERLKYLSKRAESTVQTYRDKGNFATLESLLDFACRFETAEDPLLFDNDDCIVPEDTDYGVKLTLQPYQVQTVHWMLRRELSPLGALDELYVKESFPGAGLPRKEFYYSPVLGTFRFDNPKGVRGGLICEEMGLGKTIEAVCVIQLNKRPAHEVGTTFTAKWPQSPDTNDKVITRAKTTLIITAPSLIGQWCDEIHKHCSDGKKLTYYQYHGGSRKSDIAFLTKHDVVLTTYGTINSILENIMKISKSKAKTKKKHTKPLHLIEWWRVVVDEGHALKTSANSQSKVISLLRTPHRWILTGTPFCNSLTDIQNQFAFVGFNQFNHGWFNERSKDFGTANLDPCMPALYLTRSLIMRHRKAQSFNGRDIVKLPQKHERLIHVEFETAEQKEAYRLMYEAAHKTYEYAVKLNNVSRNYFLLMQSLTPARRACSGFDVSRSQIEEKHRIACEKLAMISSLSVHKNKSSSENNNLNINPDDPESLQKLAQTDEDAFNDDKECLVCFEIMEHMLMTPCKHMFCAGCISEWVTENHNCPICRQPIDGENNLKLKVEQIEEKKSSDDSHLIPAIPIGDRVKFDSKVKVLMRELKKLREEKPSEKVLIFTMFQETQAWLVRELQRNGFDYRELKGSMTVKQREKALDAFKSAPPTTVFVLTIRTGAVGITLTCANHVFLMEPCLNDALARQAANRVYRLGQRKQVYITTFVMKDTIEEKIIEMHREARIESGRAGHLRRDRATCNQLTKLFS